MGPNVEGFGVASWCPAAGAAPEAVAVIFNVPEAGDIVLRLRSKQSVNKMIDALETHRDMVFGED